MKRGMDFRSGDKGREEVKKRRRKNRKTKKLSNMFWIQYKGDMKNMMFLANYKKIKN